MNLYPISGKGWGFVLFRLVNIRRGLKGKKKRNEE
jgi:hypothetical protein